MFKLPKSVLVVIFSGDEILLLERVRPADFWQSVTGSLEPGEDWRDAAIREVAEETGFAAGELQPTTMTHRFPILPEWRHRYAPGVTENEEHAFFLPLASPLTPRLNPAEHCAFSWLSSREAEEKVASWTNRAAIRALREGNY